jgi:hypothetical protein
MNRVPMPTLMCLLVAVGSAAARAGLPARIAVSCRADTPELGDAGRAHTEDALLNAGFEVVEPTLGGEAEFVAAVRLTCKPLPPEGGRQYRSATLRYRVFDVPAAEVIAAGSARETGWGTSPDAAADTAVKYAAQKAVRSISGKIKERLGLYVDYAVVFSIEIHDSQAETISQRLASRLGNIEGIGLVHRQPTDRQTWELRLFSREQTQVVGPRVETVLAETGLEGRPRQGNRFVLIGQDLRSGRSGDEPTTIACLAVVNRIGRADLDSWTRGLPDLIDQELLARPGFRVVERRRVKEVLAEADLTLVLQADADTARRLGQKAGADRLVIGELTTDPTGDLTLALRSIDVSDGHLVQIIRVRGDDADIEAFEALIRQAVRNPPNSVPSAMLSPW